MMKERRGLEDEEGCSWVMEERRSQVMGRGIWVMVKHQGVLMDFFKDLFLAAWLSHLCILLCF